jgi:hypothetical protein
MMNGGEGVGQSAETARLSRERIIQILLAGTSKIAVDQIIDRLLSQVDLGGGKIVNLGDWAIRELLQAQCNSTIFPDPSQAAYAYLIDLTLGAGVSVDEIPESATRSAKAAHGAGSIF